MDHKNKARRSDIKTHHDFPPVPIRSMDWSAWIEGTEESGPYGHGPTEEAAVADLLDQLEDM